MAPAAPKARPEGASEPHRGDVDGVPERPTSNMDDRSSMSTAMPPRFPNLPPLAPLATVKQGRTTPDPEALARLQAEQRAAADLERMLQRKRNPT